MLQQATKKFEASKRSSANTSCVPISKRHGIDGTSQSVGKMPDILQKLLEVRKRGGMDWPMCTVLQLRNIEVSLRYRAVRVECRPNRSFGRTNTKTFKTACRCCHLRISTMWLNHFETTLRLLAPFCEHHIVGHARWEEHRPKHGVCCHSPTMFMNVAVQSESRELVIRHRSFSILDFENFGDTLESRFDDARPHPCSGIKADVRA